jgi:hypothetical protein
MKSEKPSSTHTMYSIVIVGNKALNRCTIIHRVVSAAATFLTFNTSRWISRFHGQFEAEEEFFQLQFQTT